MAEPLSASLHFLTGPLRGEIVSLAEGEHSIGRDPTNRLQIKDPSLSRHHCTIAFQDGQLAISDCNSVNGTYVADSLVKSRALQDADVIRIGGSEILVMLRHVAPREGFAETPVRLEEDPELVSSSTVVVRREEARYRAPALDAGPPPASTRVERDFRTLLAISAALAGLRRSGDVQRRLLELVLKVVPATYGAVVLTGGSDESLGPIVGLRAAPGPDLVVSRTAVRRAISQKVAVLSSVEQGDREFKEADSLVLSRARAVLCAPMSVADRVMGAIYLAALEPGRRFDDDDLELVMGAANVAALALENATHFEDLEAEAETLRADLKIQHDLVGGSPAMQAIDQKIAKVAAADSSVLIRGESGTGKGLVARAIHASSRRASKPFVSISCANLGEHLLESELFGHERGAFTGAVDRKIGKLERANGGTVFLDEIAEMTPTVQAKLLRVLQDRVFERLGSTMLIKVDVRVVAATHRDLEEGMRLGTFRSDLFFRLNVIQLNLPPLRERKEDVRMLASFFLDRLRERCTRRVAGFSSGALRALESHDWPGNVRELENAIEHAVVFGTTEKILPEDLPEAVLERAPSMTRPSGRYYDAVNDAKQQIILGAIQEAGGNLRQTARDLGLNPGYLHRLMNKLGLREQLGRSQ